MEYLGKHFKMILVLLIATAVIVFYSFSGRSAVTDNDFVGKWKSTRSETPTVMYPNGEWEIRTNDGAVLQYGIWQYKSGNIIWSYKIDSQIGQDANAVLSVAPGEFKLRENDGTTTIFTRLD